MALLGLGDDGSDDAGAIGKVMDDTYVRKACLATELGRGIEGTLVELTGKQAAGAQHVRRRVEQAAEDIEAVGAPSSARSGSKSLTSCGSERMTSVGM